MRKIEGIMSIFQDIAKLEKDNFSDAWSEKSLEDTFEYDYNHLLVEKRDGKVVGYVIYSDVQGEAELLRIAVDKAYRRRGIAALLMQNMLDELTESGAERVSLEVRAHNISAVTLYKKFGFIERPNEDFGPGMHQWICSEEEN
jgi:ribosomal-protein-alanine N-acetyltransferase